MVSKTVCVILIWSLSVLVPAGFAQEIRETSRDRVTRLKAWDDHVKLERESIFKDLKWRAVGPRFIGGRIESIAVPPGNNYTIYVGVGSGNIWKTINNGVTWEPIFENESTFTIGEISICPSNPDIIWVGTGEVLMARSSYAGTGIFKSTDAGKTWRNMGLHDTHHIGRVLIDPKNPDVVYVAAIGHNFSYNKQRGLFKTTDGGKTWEKSLYISEKIGVIDVEMDPQDSNTLYAATWERSRKAWGHTVCGAGSAIYKSTDAGRSWKRITNGFITGEYVGRITLEVSASNPDVLYALVDNEAPRPEQSTRGSRRSRTIRGEVYRSDNKGETWRKVNEDYLGTTIGYDFNLMRISPDNENEIWVGGNRFLTSKDGGKTYRQIETTIVHLMPKPKKLFSLDQHALWIDPANTNHLVLGNDHGLYFTYDRGDNWLHMNNLPIGEFYAVSVDMATPYNIYGGNQDNAAVKGSSDFEIADGIDDPWEYVFLDIWGGGDGFITLADPTDTDKVYFFSGHSVSLKDMKTGRSKRITPRANPGDPPLRFNWMTPMIISPHDPRTLYYGANKLFKSTNKGTSWTCISPDLSTNPAPERRGNIPYGACTTISESPIKPGLIYIGTDDGNIQVTNNDGKTWNKINIGPPGKWVTRVTASQYEVGTVYASLTGYREDDFEKYLYMSMNYGKTWKFIAGNIPSESINVIKEDPKNKNVLYVGTDLGVYTSIDRGKSWISLCNNLPTTPVYDLVVHPRDNELVIGTHGRSIFVLDVNHIQNFVSVRPRTPGANGTAASDDAEEDVGGSATFEIDLTSTDLELMYDNNPADPLVEQVVGLRFVGVPIPKGSTITEAWVQFDADDVDDPDHVGNAYILIDGELNPAPVTFENTPNNITGRSRTTAKVQWTSEPWPADGGNHQKALTTDISSIIQEIVNQDGWAGSALVLIFSQDPATPSVGHRECESFDGAGSNIDQRPTLHITYQ